ncbi:MAG: dimethylaniline monooxygenase, partial [Okeania sp. SIO3B3]|nr:dimethylaniline monooxygenase [Okeania sp. SIO3B3]
LYKGCIHPDMPGLAFTGTVRPTIGSIPAMAEMQSRFIAQVFSGGFELPEKEELKKLIKKEADDHARKNPKMTERWPHIYFFDEWMEEMAELIGTQPKIWQHLGSWKQLQGFLFGAPMPLRFRQYGHGMVEGAKEGYAERINHLYGTPPVSYAVLFLFMSLSYPYIISLLIAAFCFWGTDLSPLVSFSLGLVFYTLYMTVDVFRFVVAFLPITLPIQMSLEDTIPWGNFKYESKSRIAFTNIPEDARVDYSDPQIFATGELPKGKVLDREVAAKS